MIDMTYFKTFVIQYFKLKLGKNKVISTPSSCYVQENTVTLMCLVIGGFYVRYIWYKASGKFLYNKWAKYYPAGWIAF